MSESTYTFDSEPELRALADRWYDETDHLSTDCERNSHPAHLRIIAIGFPAIAFILNEMRKGRGRWFAALAAIAGPDAVASVNRSATGDSTDALERAWIEWGTPRFIR